MIYLIWQYKLDYKTNCGNASVKITFYIPVNKLTAKLNKFKEHKLPRAWQYWEAAKIEQY